MPRYAFKIEYDGRPFSGWQRQAEHPSVQGAIEDALSKLEPDIPSIAAAGRTDAGVHATGQVAHVDTVQQWEPFRLSEALNYHLKPLPVAITACVEVADDWHARFSALDRRYLYRVVVRRAPLVHDKGHAWRVQRGLDIGAMRIAAQHLVGRHNFTTFRSTMCQAKSPIKTLDEIAIEEVSYNAGHEVQFKLRARSFLHNQVRSIVGTLERVGAGTWSPSKVKEALEAEDRSACGPVAPPDGLYLTGVSYDPEIF
jgi:tRNA pseudouridine38-40 synthase